MARLTNGKEIGRKIQRKQTNGFHFGTVCFKTDGKVGVERSMCCFKPFVDCSLHLLTVHFVQRPLLQRRSNEKTFFNCLFWQQIKQNEEEIPVNQWSFKHS